MEYAKSTSLFYVTRSVGFEDCIWTLVVFIWRRKYIFYIFVVYQTWSNLISLSFLIKLTFYHHLLTLTFCWNYQAILLKVKLLLEFKFYCYRKITFERINTWNQKINECIKKKVWKRKLSEEGKNIVSSNNYTVQLSVKLLWLQNIYRMMMLWKEKKNELLSVF